jgi:hypothetical protein
VRTLATCCDTFKIQSFLIRGFLEVLCGITKRVVRGRYGEHVSPFYLVIKSEAPAPAPASAVASLIRRLLAPRHESKGARNEPL